MRNKIKELLEKIPDNKLERVYNLLKYIYIHG